ncbi:GNAT family N-acetyltransferase [Lentzea roselyniae]|uniref:GNAT family N-acetyltransferase n=1 Tax=Lentzea roselyniae TaxID=531940 RepID=A0ABP7AG25_9PSEU
MIKRIDLSDDAVLDEVFTVQRLGYAVEAEIIGFDRIPGLLESRDDLRATQHEFLGYYDEEGLAGAIAFVRRESELDICRMFVHPRAHRRGIASQLIDAAGPAERTIVSTGTKNEPALRLYRKHGFVEIGTREVAPGVSITELVRENH